MSMHPTFPGGTSVSMLEVYNDAAGDGLRGGSPHVHLASTEAYIITSGHGRLQTLSMQGFQETALQAGSIVWFTPGTVHRAVNDGGLAAVVLMSNAGLPEAGDAVLTFPADVLTSAEAYSRAADLGDGDERTRRSRAAQRRDLAVEGFCRLREASQSGSSEPFIRFLEAAGALVRERAGGWESLIRGNAFATAQRDIEVSGAIARGSVSHLADACVQEADVSGSEVLGMCGRLRKYDTRGER